jgi:hypothetical protein
MEETKAKTLVEILSDEIEKHKIKLLLANKEIIELQATICNKDKEIEKLQELVYSKKAKSITLSEAKMNSTSYYKIKKNIITSNEYQHISKINKMLSQENRELRIKLKV